MANQVIISGRTKKVRTEERKNGKTYYETSFVLINSKKVGEKWRNVRVPVKYFSYHKPQLQDGIKVVVVGELRNDPETLTLFVRASQILTEVSSAEEEVKEAEEKYSVENEEEEVF